MRLKYFFRTHKKTQLTKAGARLAQLLGAIWPDATASNRPAKHLR